MMEGGDVVGLRMRCDEVSDGKLTLSKEGSKQKKG